MFLNHTNRYGVAWCTMLHLICGNCPDCFNFQTAVYSSMELIVRSPEGCKVIVSARDIAPTPAGSGGANESQSFSQSNQIPFSRLERTDSGLHNIPRTVIFNLFLIVVHFPTQGILTTHFFKQNLISVAKIW